jgi:hypothetical protein
MLATLLIFIKATALTLFCRVKLLSVNLCGHNGGFESISLFHCHFYKGFHSIRTDGTSQPRRNFAQIS